jgi:glycosyltransferase involved in cell wall biosynthesis
MKLFSIVDVPIIKNSLFFMGSLDIASSLATILQAVNKVQKKKDVSFTVAGGGLLENDFKKLSRDTGMNVSFTGHLPINSIVPYIASADVCLVYYDKKEANTYRSSMKLREYLAMNKKVVCNDLFEMREFASFTYQSSSEIDDFADKIVFALSHSDGRELGGREYIKENYDWESEGRRFYEKLTMIGKEAI